MPLFCSRNQAMALSDIYRSVLCDEIYDAFLVRIEILSNGVAEHLASICVDPHPSLLYVITKCNYNLGIAMTTLNLPKFGRRETHTSHIIPHSLCPFGVLLIQDQDRTWRASASDYGDGERCKCSLG